MSTYLIPDKILNSNNKISIQDSIEDPHLIFLGEDDNKNYLISKKAIFLWLANLNIKLAKEHKFRVDDEDIMKLTEHLSINNVWESFLKKLFEFGHQFGLLGVTHKPSVYSLPIAYVLSSMTPVQLKAAEKYLETFAQQSILQTPSQEIVLDEIEKCLACLTPRERRIVNMREGLLGKPKMTLEQIGQELNITRERVRQIESKAWERLNHPDNQTKLVKILLLDLMKSQGSLIFTIADNNTSFIRNFVAKCNQISVYPIPRTNMRIMSHKEEQIDFMRDMDGLILDQSETADFIEQRCRIPVMANDLSILANSIYQVTSLRRAKRVYLALKKIGRPAHHTEVTYVYNDLFPRYKSNDHNIYSELTRGKEGTVWVGRGTYALTEWGCERL